MNQASYITHVELENPNLIPEIKVYMYATSKHTTGTSKTTLESQFTNNYSAWYNKSSIDLNLWNGTLKRFDITPFAINVGSINYRTSDEFMSTDNLSSSTTLTLLKSIEDFYTGLTNEQKGFHFDTIQNQDESFSYGNSNKINAFNVAGYSQDGLYADIEIRLTIKDQSGNDLGLVSGGTVLFRGLVNSVQNQRNEVVLEILDGLIEARRKQNRVGETIRSEISSYKERFYGANTDFQYDLGEVYDMSAVKENRTYNLKHFPVIPPLRDSEDKVVKLKIQRESPIDFLKKDKVSTPLHEVYQSTKFVPSEVYTNYGFVEGEQVEKTLKNEELNWNKFEVDWENGILKFELPPIIDPEGSLFIEEYKTAYKHKHPSFLAEKLFEELGYENVNFTRENLSPYYPSDGESYLYEWKIPSKRGVVTKHKDGMNFGATAIHYCEHDKLYYYFTKGGIYKTDFETINEKVCTTSVRNRYNDGGTWKKVNDTNRGNNINELDVNQITTIRPHNENTTLRIIATVNRNIEFEEDNPYDIPYPRSRVALDGSGAGYVSQENENKYPDRDKKFDWNYDNVNNFDSIPGGENYFNNPLNKEDGKLIWSTGSSTRNWDTSSFNRWRKDTICTLYYYDIENFFDNSGNVNTFYYYHDGSIYSKNNAGVVTKLFDITHDADKVTFLSSHTYTNDNEQSQTESNVIRVDYTSIGSSPSKVRIHYSSSGTRLGATVFKSPISGSIIFAQNSEPTKLHNLDFDNDSDTNSGDEMLPVDPLFIGAEPHVYGKDNANLHVSTNPRYYKDKTSTSVKHIGWRTKKYNAEDLEYINEHTLLYGDKINNNFVIIEDSSTNKQILVALEIATDESTIGMRSTNNLDVDNVNYTKHGYNNNAPGRLPKAKGRFYEKAIYLCFYDISQTTLSESNKQRVGTINPRGNAITGNSHLGGSVGNDNLPLDYIGFALQRFNIDCKIKDSFIGADILYEKEDDNHFIYVLLNDVIMRFKWQPDHNKIPVSSQITSMPGYGSGVVSELKDALSITRDVKGSDNSGFARFDEWRTDNLMIRIPDYNYVANRKDEEFIKRSALINSIYVNTSFVEDEFKTSVKSQFRPLIDTNQANLKTENHSNIRVGTQKNFKESKIHSYFHNDLWNNNSQLIDFRLYGSFCSFNSPYSQDYENTNYEYRKEKQAYSYDLGLRSYQYLLFGHVKDHHYRVSQVYGLTKMAGKNVFSFYTVNRECQSKVTTRRGRYNLEGKLVKYRNTDDKLFEHNLEGMMAYQYTIDFDEKTFINDPAPNLRLSTEVYPTALHQQYYDLLNEITKEIQLIREEVISEGGVLQENSKFQQLIPHGRLKNITNETFKDLIPYEDRGDQASWSGDLWMGITQTKNQYLTTETSSEYYRILTPYKSKYWAYSVYYSDFQHDTNNQANKSSWRQYFFDNRSFVVEGLSQNKQQTSNGKEARLTASYKLFTQPQRIHAYMNARRREYASYNILPSLLPKTSKDIGSEIVHLIGNYGEYQTSTKLLGLANIWEDQHPILKQLLSNVNEWNKQDTHGTVSLTTGNFDYPTSSGGSRRYLSKNLGIMYKEDPENVYKDFLCKPIIQKDSEKEDIHFVVGQSIGNKKMIRETILNSSAGVSTNSPEYNQKALQLSKTSEPLNSSRLYDPDNCMWITLSHHIIPSIPLGDFSNTNIYESLKMLATVMDYNFGIEDNVPFFKPKEDYFYHDYSFAPYQNFDYIEPLPTGKETNSYYYMSGEIIFIKTTASQNITGQVVEGKLEVERKINSSTVYPKEMVSAIRNSVTYGSTTSTRVSQILYRPLYKIKMVIDEKNIIDIQKLNFPYESNYTDIHLSYSDKTYKRKIKNSNSSTKKIFSKSIPLIDDINWIKFLGRKIQKEISYDRTSLSITTKINPSLRGNDYIAVFFTNSEITIGTVDTTSINSVNLGNVYELYKIKSVSHNLDSFTSTIEADSVETSSIGFHQGALVNS